ncbi:Retrovirus-related Pol polyprotein from transposon RE2 [Glycine soja]|uniref:Retrovirus-related Pol polyprotein from transposon RE2 n=1 Tax=Glycine soja TaxID=3848 RepID=A0A445EZY5_GLYSO|nr:Retrovirus-related Pol polyprotein from transposon RE2 [Glycine soja]
MTSAGPTFSFSGTPIITTAKLNWKNYLSWSASVELWFLGQGYHDHLEKGIDTVPSDRKSEWEKLDYQLCAVLWQSVEANVLEILRSFKTCCSFWKKAREIFANDIQSLFDATMKVTALKQTSHDMIAHIGKARAAVEELKRFLVADSLEEVNKKLDKFYMVLILRSLHSDFDHVRDQVLAGDQVPSMDSLITRLLRVPHVLKEENPADTMETSAMVATRGRGGGRNSRGGRSGREKSESKFSDEEYQEYLKLKSEKSSCQASSSSVPCYSTACISQSIDGPIPWILDSGASDHISGNKSSFSSISFPKIPHLVTVANGSKVAAQGSGQEHGTGRLIGEGRESRGLYYLKSNVSVSCFATSNPKLLHNRLGHPSLPKLKMMVPSLKNLRVLEYKLSARAIKCVFVGYSRLQKGYKCYSPSTRRYYMSADVTFFEDTPFFSPSTDHSSSIQNVLPISSPCPLGISHQNVNEISPSPPHPTEVASPPLLTHERRTQTVGSPIPEASPHDSHSSSINPQAMDPASSPSSDSDWPIAIRKGTRSTRNPHPIYNFLSYHRLSPSYSSFVFSLSSHFVPSNTHEALSHPGWRQAMIDEMQALEHNGTWELVSLPPGKKTVGCRWVYAVKVGPNGEVDRLKARLVAKGYTQIYGLDYYDTFSPVAKITTVRLFLAMAAMRHWPLHQLDIKNVFLHGDLEEDIYMERPPGFVAQGEYDLVEADHSVFYCQSSPGKCVYLIVYVDDIVITGNDATKIVQLKEHLFSHFQTKDLGYLKYFLGIEVAQSGDGVVISQRKYALDILEETGMQNCRPVDSPMDPNLKLMADQSDIYPDPERYRRLVGKLIYLTITRPDISFAVGVISQFMQSPHVDHWNAVMRILRYIKRAPGQGLLYEDKGNMQVSGYCDADWAGCPIDRKSTSEDSIVMSHQAVLSLSLVLCIYVYVLKSIPLRLYANYLSFTSLTFSTSLDWTNIGRLHCLLPWWEDATVDFMTSGGYNVASQIEKVKQKTLIIWGENDRIISNKLAVRLHCELADAIIRQIPDCGHLPHVERPDSVVKFIVEFVQSKTNTEKECVSPV